MISTILTSIHTFGALLLAVFAVLTFMAGRRSKQAIYTAVLLFTYALASVAFGLSFNSYTSDQVAPWVVLLVFATYPVAPAALLVAITQLRPELSKKVALNFALVAVIVLPILLTVADLTNLSQQIFSSNVLVTLEPLARNYAGGYASPDLISTPGGDTFFRLYLIIFYTAIIIYSAIVLFQDRQKDKFNRTNAGILLISTVLSTATSTVIQDFMPPTVGALFSNAFLSIGFFFVTFRISTKEKPVGGSWLQKILDDYPMFTKLTATLSIMLIPAISFLSFSTLSFFQNSLVSTATENLSALADSESQRISGLLSDDIQEMRELNRGNQIPDLLAKRELSQEGFTEEQIRQQINQYEERWVSGDSLLTSITLDPVRTIDMRSLLEENGNFLDFTLVGQYGGLITATKSSNNYRFSFTDWFLYVNEFSEPYIGEFRWNEATQSYISEIALPFFSPDGSLTGVLKAEYQLTEILETINPTNENLVSFSLANPSGNMVTRGDNGIEEMTFPPSALEPIDESQNWRAVTLSDEVYLFETAKISNFRGNFETPWRLATYQPIPQAIAPMVIVRATTIIIAIVIAGLASILTIWLTQSIVTPLVRLREAAEEIQSGKPGAVAEVTSNDEFGALAKSFNQMSTELSNVVSGLEETIFNRTKDLEQRANQLEASAVVAREAAEVQDLSTLLELTAHLVPEKFDYYHCGIFLTDELGKYAILQAANSEGGKKMLARGHRLQIGRVGVVGYCAGTGTPRIAQDVGADVVYYANPDMPETRSEMALPLIVRERIIGVLDIQSTEANAFQAEDIDILQVLADQLALAIDNTRLLESSQKALKELEVLYGNEAAKSWRDSLAGAEIAYAYDATGLIKSGTSAVTTIGQNQTPLTKPITFRGQVIGNLDFARDISEGNWTDEEGQLIEDILEQTALALENARLMQQIRLRSDQIRLLQEITSMAASIMDEGQLLQSVAEKLQTSLKAQHCGVVLREESGDLFTLVSTVTSGKSDIQVGNRININEDPITQEIVEKAANLTFNQVVGNSRFQVFVQTFSTKKPSSIITLPLVIRDEVSGYIFLEDTDVDKTLDQEENDLFNQINAQISTALESARLFKAEQEGRQAAAALLEITQIASASLDINRVLNQATNRSAQAIQAHRCTVFTLDEKEKIKPLVSVYATGQPMQGEEWDTLREKVRETYQNTPLRSLASSMREVAIVSNPTTYKAFPLDWTSAFDIKNLLMIPLISQNKVVGTMIYDQVNPAFTFRKNQVELAQTIAGQIATTIENANLFEEAVTRAERERQITEITAKIRSSNDPKEIMETAISELRAALAKSTIESKQTPQKKQIVGTNGKETGQN